MSSAEEEAPPPFKTALPDIAKWFSDRNLPYTRRIEDRLVEEGVESLEEMKLFDDWEALLRDASHPDSYKPIKWKAFQKAFATLTSEEFDELKSRPMPIKDGVSTGAGAGANHANRQEQKPKLYAAIAIWRQKTRYDAKAAAEAEAQHIVSF